jgi:hypothetical protein
MLKSRLVLLMPLLVLALLCGCRTQSPAEGGLFPSGDGIKDRVTIAITRDFGKELMLERSAEIDIDTSALEALESIADIETKYGGGFVSSINGIGSAYSGSNGQKNDWFFYINGISSNVGAADYLLRAGDIEHWDFRDWGHQRAVPAIIGDYPQPFRSGFGYRVAPTILVFEEPFASEAESLLQKLKTDGVVQAAAVRHDRLSGEDRENNNLIIIAGPENTLVVELNEIHKKLGFYVHIESGRIIVLDDSGSVSREYGPGCGLIQATQNPWNPKGTGACENVVWMVTGADEDGVKSAAQAIYDGDSLRHACAAIVSGGEVVKIP